MNGDVVGPFLMAVAIVVLANVLVQAWWRDREARAVPSAQRVEQLRHDLSEQTADGMVRIAPARYRTLNVEMIMGVAQVAGCEFVGEEDVPVRNTPAVLLFRVPVLREAPDAP